MSDYAVMMQRSIDYAVDQRMKKFPLPLRPVFTALKETLEKNDLKNQIVFGFNSNGDLVVRCNRCARYIIVADTETLFKDASSIYRDPDNAEDKVQDIALCIYAFLEDHAFSHLLLCS